MDRCKWIRSLTLGALMLAFTANPAAAGDFGTKAEAKAMLDRVVVALEADEAKALASFAAGEAGFKDRDLYPYCGGPNGQFSAHPKLTGKPLKGLKDKTGHDFGTVIYEKAKAGSTVEVPYMWPRPGSTEPVAKVALVRKVGTQICAVGYYK